MEIENLRPFLVSSFVILCTKGMRPRLCAYNFNEQIDEPSEPCESDIEIYEYNECNCYMTCTLFLRFVLNCFIC